MLREFDDAVEKSDYIFLGISKKVEFDKASQDKFKGIAGGGDSMCGDKYVTFEVKKQWKGKKESEIKIFSPDGCVGLGGYFSEGREYLVYAGVYDGKIMTSVCGRSRDVTEPVPESKTADDDIKKLDSYNWK
jgi:hypothetical protein